MKQLETLPVYLTDEEAFLFIEFQKRYAFIRLLESIGAFRIKSGSVTIHFNNLGEIATIDKHEHFKALK